MICNKIVKNNKGMSYHFRISHNLDYIKYLVDNKFINVPKCIHCNGEINILSGRGRVLILNSPEKLKYCSNKCKLNNDNYKLLMIEAGKKGGASTLGRKASEEEKINKKKLMLSRWSDKKYKNKMIKSITGVKRSKLARKNMSIARKGMKFSEQHKKNISIAVSKCYTEGKIGKNKIEYYSIKMNKKIFCRSSYELKFAFFLDLNDDVVNWYFESIVLKNSDSKRYIPDFTVEFKDNTRWLVEIDKFKGFKEKYGYGWKIELGKNYSLKNNMIYKYIDLSDINLLFSEKFPILKLSNINLYKQKSKFKNEISKNMSELFSNSKIEIDKLNEIKKEIFKKNNIKFDTDTINNKKLNTRNNNALKDIYNNFWSCKWKNARFSPIEALNYKTTFTTIIKNLIKYEKDINRKNILAQLNKELYSISFFSDTWAYWIYQKNIDKTENLKILDICGGFGGRILGFYHFIKHNKVNNFEYDYVDLNKETCANTEKLINILSIDNINVINSSFENNAEIFCKRYDLLFTSIPYYDIEVYNDVDLKKIYIDKNEFTLNFINKIFQLDCKKIIINISEKYSDVLINNLFVNYREYKLNKIQTIEVDSNFLRKNIIKKKENFYIFEK
jgi:hypothetical protein